MKNRSGLRYALVFLLTTTLTLTATCTPTPTPTRAPVPSTLTPTIKAVGATVAPTKGAPTHTPSPTYTPLPTEAVLPAKRVVSIKVEAGATVVHYQDETFWNEAQFCSILKHKAEFDSKEIEKLKMIASRYEVVNHATLFDKAEKSVSSRCQVHGAVSKRDGSFYGDFSWVIRPLELDFINDCFKETTKGLSWKGTIDGIPTEVICQFPPQDVPYAAWAQPIGHCHAHVWWTITK